MWDIISGVRLVQADIFNISFYSIFPNITHTDMLDGNSK
jgi:hypothetical protein